jgi:hypothetical protein
LIFPAPLSSLPRILEENDIPVAPHLILDRNKTSSLVEKDDNVFVDDKSISKPFVVKPVNAEDHDVCGIGKRRLLSLPLL